MKRLMISVLTCSVLAISVTPVQAAPKVGATCKRLGEISHISNQTLICSKVGKTLKYKSIDSNVADSVNKPIVDGKVDPMVLKAYTAFDHTSCTGKQSNFNVTYYSAPDYSAQMLSKQKILMNQAMACYNDYFDKKIDIAIAFGNQNDSEFLTSQLFSGKPLFNSTVSRWIKGMSDRISTTGSGTGSRAAGSAGWSTSLNSAWIVILDSTFNSSPDAHMASHEFVHILQSYSRSKFFENYGEGSSSADYVNMPPWFWEGTGELFSYASINPTVSGFDAIMLEARNQGKESPSLNKIKTEDQVISTLQKLQAPSNQEANMMGYALGSVTCEYILATYGYAKYWQIMKGAGIYLDFNENLTKTIGIGLNELYANAAPFVLSQWKLNNF